jgi:acyl-CoA synthetase (AMP-forming)/AMP-acid ligase II
VRADTIARFVEAFAVERPATDVIVPCYGLAEATLIVSGSRGERDAGVAGRTPRAGAGRLCAPTAGEDEAVLVASGRPAEEHEVAIVDADAQHPCRRRPRRRDLGVESERRARLLGTPAGDDGDVRRATRRQRDDVAPNR